jgi:hypothetical protein
MPRVVARCPITGQDIDVGIETDESSFARIPHFVGQIFCPHCSAEHEWSKDRARVIEHKSSRG